MKRCITCSRPMRKVGQLKRDFPGTIAPGSKGKCNVCYEKHRNLTTGKPQAATVIVTREAREVPVRVHLTPSTYKTLRMAKVNIDRVLSKLADQAAQEVSKRA